MRTQQSHNADTIQSQAEVSPLPSHELSDESLLRALAGGAAWAMEPLYHRYSSMLYSMTYRMVGNHQVAEDLVQETFSTVWQYAATYSAQEGLARWWLISLMRHRTIDYLRRVRRRSLWKEISWEDVDREEDIALPDVWEEVWCLLQGSQVREALLQLPREQRQVITLAYFQGWSHAEIAQRCDLPFGTVKSRLRLGLLHLKQILEPREGGKLAPPSKRKEVRPRHAAVVVQATENTCPTGYELSCDGVWSCFGYTEWEPLVEQISAFEFLGASGSFLARKEKQLHGRGYWYAFRWGGAHRQRAYLGRSSELTLARLEAMARTLYE